jgi:hypothetical protein
MTEIHLNRLYDMTMAGKYRISVVSGDAES